MIFQSNCFSDLFLINWYQKNSIQELQYRLKEDTSLAQEWGQDWIHGEGARGLELQERAI